MPRDVPDGLDLIEVERLIDIAIAEDLGAGDITSQAVIPEGLRFTGTMSARQPIVCAGMPVAAMVFARFSEDIAFSNNHPDPVEPYRELGPRGQDHRPLYRRLRYPQRLGQKHSP